MLRQNFDDGVYPCHKCTRQRKCTTIKSMEKCRVFVEYRAKYGEPPIDITVSPCDSCEKVHCTRFKECAVYLRLMSVIARSSPSGGCLKMSP